MDGDFMIFCKGNAMSPIFSCLTFLKTALLTFGSLSDETRIFIFGTDTKTSFETETFLRPRLRFFLKTRFFETETFLETTIFETDTFFLDRYQSKTLKNNGNSLVKEAVKTFF